MNIRLNLNHHCIETEIKRLYNRAISEYFKTGSDKNRLEKRVEMLKTALEESDFNSLRGKYPELAGHSDTDVILSKNNRNQIVITINRKISDFPISKS